MYSKDELLSKDAAELADIAKNIGADINANGPVDDIVYSILDKQAEVEGNKNPLGTKRKRVRIAKKDDRVYSVNGTEGENFDLKKNKTTATAKAIKETENNASNEPAPIETAEAPVAEETPVKATRTRRTKAQIEADAAAAAAEPAAPKKRGRRTKAQIEADAAAAAATAAEINNINLDDNNANMADAPSFITDRIAENAQATDNETAQQQPTEETIAAPEEMFNGETQANDGEEMQNDLIEALKAKVKAHNEKSEEKTPMHTRSLSDGVWAGDPGDGTDFITLVDLPIEDQSAIPNVDIFDNPVGNIAKEQPLPVGSAAKHQEAKYNFDNLITANGVLEVMPDGYGFLRSSDYNYLSSPDDIYVSAQQVKNNALKTGDVVECRVRPPREGEKYFPITSIDKINGRIPSEVRDRVAFEHLTPLFPEEKFTLCGDPVTTNLSTRIVDLFSPIGKGQRALIVAQPKTGKTMLMKNIANAIAANHPEAYLMMLLIDERPEEVTDMARTVNAEVIASTFDEPAERHVKIAGIVLEKAKRMVECGHDVVIFLDSITRLARAYNTVAPASGKVLTGGVDANALQKPKRFFGAARNIEGGGSLTIIATALIDTGSKMDEVIFEEFKGTGNMELQLDRSLSNKRKFPSINLVASSTRRDDLLHPEAVNSKMAILRQNIADMTTLEAWNTVEKCMQNSRNPEEFFMAMNS